MTRLPDTVRNPFSSSVTGDPWESGNTDSVDVSEIHRDVFERCLQAITAVRTNQSSSGILIHGEAGSGKTHLLKRLRSHCLKTADDLEPWRIDQAFVAVRLQVDAGMLWRYLRQRLVDDLLRSAGGGPSQFEHAVMLRAAALADISGDLYLWWEYIAQEPSDELDILLESVSAAAQLDYSFQTVVGRLMRRKDRALARSWLRGDSLTDAALQRLGCPGDDPDMDPETAAQEFVLALCRLIGPLVPIVICFDQVEALLRNDEDTASLAALGRLISTLQSGSSNVLTVACLQTAVLATLRRAIRDSDHDRMVQAGELRLSHLNARQATLVVRRRLAAVPEITALRPAGAERVWPLSSAEIETVVGDGCTPRTLISRCARLLQHPPQVVSDESADPPLSAERLDQHLSAELRERLESVPPPDGSSVRMMLGHVLPWLLEHAGQDEAWQVSRTSELPDVDYVAVPSSGEARVGISIRNEENMTSLAAHLRRLKQQTDSLQKLVIIRDARLPISPGAKATQRHLKELEQNDAQLWRPSAELLAALQAIRDLLAQSQAGDLSCDGTTIGPASLQEWLRHALNDALSIVRVETEGLLRPPVPGGFEFEPDAEWLISLREYLQQQPVAALEDAARHCGVEQGELARRLNDIPQECVVLQGEPQVIFRAVSG